MPYAAPYPPPVTYLPPKKDNLVLIIVVVVIILVALPVVMSAILYALVSGLIGGAGPAPPLMAIVSKSSNGSYWLVTLTSVQGGMTPEATDLSMATSASFSAVPPTPLSALPGGNVTLQNALGTLYIAYHGALPGAVHIGDTILIAASTSRGASTTGYNLQLSWNGSTFRTSLG